MVLPESPDDRRARLRRYVPVEPEGEPLTVHEPRFDSRRQQAEPPPGNGGRFVGGWPQAARGGAEPRRPQDNAGRRPGSPPHRVSPGQPPARPPAQPPVQPPVQSPAGGPPPDERPTEVVEPVPAAQPPRVEPQRVVEPNPDGAGDDLRAGRHRRRAGASPNSYPASAYLPKVSRASSGEKKAGAGRRRKTAFWKELPLLVVVALLLTFLIQTFLARVYEIPSGSMETTLHGCAGCTDDRVLVDKISYRFHDPQPGDVVVFRGPDSWTNTEFSVAEPSGVLQTVLRQLGSLVGLAPPDEKDFVKRVIAVGGQTVSCCDTRNRVMVDGKPLDEPYIYYLPEAGPARQIPFGPVTVPQGDLWVMGDSRNNSADSRVTGHGPIPVASVIGQARLIVLPITRFGLVPQTDPQPPQALGSVGMDAPAALGLLGTIPIALARRPRLRFTDDEFLPGGGPSPGRSAR